MASDIKRPTVVVQSSHRHSHSAGIDVPPSLIRNDRARDSKPPPNTVTFDAPTFNTLRPTLPLLSLVFLGPISLPPRLNHNAEMAHL